MTILFTGHNIGRLAIKNRFIFSACEDGSATEIGEVTERIIANAGRLAKNEVGMIISGHLSVHPLGRTRRKQTGIHDDRHIPGLAKVVKTVHQYDCKMVFQLGHAGLQTSAQVIGHPPLGPSSGNPLDDEGIDEIIASFISSAARAAEAGADGIQIHAAHGYLVNQFLSPYYNQRTDSWNGADANRFKLLDKIITGIQTILPEKMAIMVKLNANDYTRTAGITPDLAVSYAGKLSDLGIDALEISCGTSLSSPWHMCRGDVPIEELLLSYPDAQKARVEAGLKKMVGKYDLVEGYNLDAVKMIRPVMKGIPVMAVGGFRSVRAMAESVQNGHTDFISLCRPLIREPALIKQLKDGKKDRAACDNCNKCLAALANELPVQCYRNGFGSR